MYSVSTTRKGMVYVYVCVCVSGKESDMHHSLVCAHVFISLLTHPHTHTYMHSVRLSNFWLAFTFYILALTVTVLVMYHFKAAQPALLYLSPACIISGVLGGECACVWFRV
jgi:hypothetical protein